MKRNSSKNADNSAKKHSGFTLVELVVVIAVLAILAGVGAVAYRGYIVYAKKGVDRQLVGEVKNAVSMEAQSDTSVLKLGVGDDRVVIGSIFISCPSKESGSQTTIADPSGVLNRALTDACGENYPTALQLKYDGWMADSTAIGGFVNDKGEQYLNAEEVMKHLYGFSDTFFEYLTNTDSKWGLGGGAMFNFVVKCLNRDSSATKGELADVLLQGGMSEGLKGMNQKNLKNAAVWAVAKYYATPDYEEEIRSAMEKNPLEGGSIYMQALDLMPEDNFSLNFDNPTETEQKMMYSLLNSYASLTMLVEYLDDKTGKNGELVDEFNKTVMDTSHNQSAGQRGSKWLSQLLNNIETARRSIAEDDELKALADEYYTNGQAKNDIDAYLDIASQVHDMQEKYNTADRNAILDENLFTGDEFVQELKENTGAGGILITAYSDGTTVVSPSDADPVSKNATDAAPEVAQGE